MGLMTETQREANIRDERALMRHEMDSKKLYHPVFCLVEVPDEYWAKIPFGEHDRSMGGDNYREIGSKSDDSSFENMQKSQSEAIATRFDEPPLYEFKHHTIDQVYDYYKCHLRPANNSNEPPHFSAFTFAVVDESCLKADPQQLLICSDAPDFGEADDAIVLKQVRVKAEIAFTVSVRIEDLSFTPKEAQLRVENLRSDCPVVTLDMEPSPPRLVRADQSPAFDGDEDDVGGELVRATPAQARAKKRAGIKAAEHRGWQLGVGWPADVNVENPAEPVWLVWEDSCLG